MKRLAFLVALVYLSTGIIQSVRYVPSPTVFLDATQGNITLLWSNASNQDSRLDALELVPPGAYDDTWVVNNVSDLWVNASVQDNRHPSNYITLYDHPSLSYSYLSANRSGANRNLSFIASSIYFVLDVSPGISSITHTFDSSGGFTASNVSSDNICFGADCRNSWSSSGYDDTWVVNNVSDLWVNASVQENAFVRKTGDNMTGDLVVPIVNVSKLYANYGSALELESGIDRINLISPPGRHALLAFRPMENSTNELFLYGYNNTATGSDGDGGLLFTSDNLEDRHFSPYSTGSGWLGSFQRFWNVTYSTKINSTTIFLNSNQGNISYPDGKCSPCRNSTEMWFG